MAQAEQPQPDQQGPYGPAGSTNVMFDTFLGIDTSAPRTGIPDEAMYWCDGFMPVEKNNLRTLYGVSAAVYTAPVGLSIVYYDFANIGAVPYCITFLSDGSIVAFHAILGTITNIAPAATINTTLGIGDIGVSQWGSQFVLIVANMNNGYFIWDGANIFQAGTVSPLPIVTDGGSQYTSSPTVSISGGHGSGVSLTANILGGQVSGVTVTSPGSGYRLQDQLVLTFKGGGSDNAASAIATISTQSGISSVAVTNGGGGYSGLSYVVPDPRLGGANLALIAASGTITGIEVINPGAGYTSAPSVSIFDPNSTGLGATFTAYLANGQIGSVSITSAGTGYTTPPTVTVIGDGVGAVLNASITSGTVSSVDIINAGTGYSRASIMFSGGNNAASATIDIMPFGVQGSAIETFQARAWIVRNNILQFTAPESVTDFATSDGGGAAPSVDSFLKVAYTRPVQTNGFLYLIADSSINYISGVQTTGTPPSTSYTNQNADPEIGTPWSAAINVFSRNIIFANFFGVHVSYGGAVTKISDPLDGVYGTVNIGTLPPSCAKAIIFGKKVWMVLLPVIDPISGEQLNKLFMWNGKYWFTSQQDVYLTFINSLEIKSDLIPYGTDGSAIYQLFARPSTGFTKTVVSKMWNAPAGYDYTKSVSRLFGLAEYWLGNAQPLNILIESENDPYTVTLSGSVDAGPYVFPPTAVGQQGSLTGITISTNARDMSLVSVKISEEIQDYNG